MSKWRILAAVFAFGVSAWLGTPSASFADERNFDFVNDSNSAIESAWVAESDSTTWGSNVLSSNIEPGATRSIYFEGELETCYYDVHVAFEGGGTGELRNLDLCNTFSITLDESYITAE